MFTENIITQLIITFGGIIAAFFVSRQQWRKDRDDAEGSREKRLDDREADFWERAKKQEAGYEKRIQYLESKLTTVLNELATVQEELNRERDMRQKLEVRIVTLEKENGNLRAENIRLKSGRGGKI